MQNQESNAQDAEEKEGDQHQQLQQPRCSQDEALDDATGKPPCRPSRISVQIKDPPVSDMRDYVPYEEKKRGPLHRAIPVMPLSLAIACCLFNIVFPGIGTVIAAFSVFCCGRTRLSKPAHACALNLASGLLQLATFILILGWIWSILWGMTFVHLSLSAKRTKQLPLVPYYVRRHSSVDF